MDWVKGFPAAVTVCDARGVIVAMNDRAAHMFRGRGGHALVGSSLRDCHPEPARARLAALLAEPRANAYTISRRGKRKMIYQAPWHENGVYAGLVEIVFDLPEAVPHFDRDAG